MASEIALTAAFKSIVQAGHPPELVGTYMQTFIACLDQYETSPRPVTPPSIPSVPVVGASAPAAGKGGVTDHGKKTLTLESLEDHGTRVRIKASGFQGAQYFSAFGDEAPALRLMQIPTVFSATVKSKPNPNRPGSNYWNIYDVKVEPNNTETAQAVHPPAPDHDIPF
jgi:hypothetical protein|tara:strand:- start:1776 stop:2279 length:504 start_codon:yes stop_codon:yes gene_type:complete